MIKPYDYFKRCRKTVFDKLHHLFMKKILSQMGVEGDTSTWQYGSLTTKILMIRSQKLFLSGILSPFCST